MGQSSATLLGHEKQGLALDHFGINKFEDNQDNNYQKVSWRILKMVREAKVDSLSKTRGISASPGLLASYSSSQPLLLTAASYGGYSIPGFR